MFLHQKMSRDSTFQCTLKTIDKTFYFRHRFSFLAQVLCEIPVKITIFQISAISREIFAKFEIKFEKFTRNTNLRLAFLFFRKLTKNGATTPKNDKPLHRIRVAVSQLEPPPPPEPKWPHWEAPLRARALGRLPKARPSPLPGAVAGILASTWAAAARTTGPGSDRCTSVADGSSWPRERLRELAPEPGPEPRPARWLAVASLLHRPVSCPFSSDWSAGSENGKNSVNILNRPPQSRQNLCSRPRLNPEPPVHRSRLVAVSKMGRISTKLHRKLHHILAHLGHWGSPKF